MPFKVDLPATITRHLFLGVNFLICGEMVLLFLAVLPIYWVLPH